MTNWGQSHRDQLWPEEQQLWQIDTNLIVTNCDQNNNSRDELWPIRWNKNILTKFDQAHEKRKTVVANNCLSDEKYTKTVVISFNEADERETVVTKCDLSAEMIIERKSDCD